MKVNERFIWAANILDVKPTDVLLEIGCGAGILTQQLAPKVTHGQLTAIDKSEAMIKMALKRNQAFVETSNVQLLKGSFLKIKLPDGYDKIFAFNVQNLWKSPDDQLEKIKKLLKPNGKFFLFHQPPSEITKQLSEQAKEQLQKTGFHINNIYYKELQPASAFCIISQLQFSSK